MDRRSEAMLRLTGQIVISMEIVDRHACVCRVFPRDDEMFSTPRCEHPRRVESWCPDGDGFPATCPLRYGETIKAIR